MLDTTEFNVVLKGSEMHLNPTRIISSPGDFNIQAVYDLEDQQKTKILFKVPLRNLFKRYSSLEEMEFNQFKGNGIPIIIESRYKKGKLKFKWKLFVNRKKRGYDT